MRTAALSSKLLMSAVDRPSKQITWKFNSSLKGGTTTTTITQREK